MPKVARSFVVLIALMVAMPVVVMAQSTPAATPAQGTPTGQELAESDALWGGNYVERLPSCDAEPLCLAMLTHDDDGGEYYYGVIQNNTQDRVFVNNVAVTLLDDDGALAAQGDVFDVAPWIVSPGGHAIIGITVTGEYLDEFTAEAEFDYFPVIAGEQDFGVPVRVDSAELRGSGVLGEWTNTSEYTFGTVSAVLACFADDGSITYRLFGDSSNGPYEPGASDRFAVEIYGEPDCENFVISAYGYS